MKNLKDYAKEKGIQYRAAWNRYKAGKIVGAFQDEMGNILIDENLNKPPYTVCYGLRRSKRKTEQLIQQLNDENNPIQ